MGAKPDFTTCCFRNPLIKPQNRLLRGQKRQLGIGRWSGGRAREPAQQAFPREFADLETLAKYSAGRRMRRKKPSKVKIKQNHSQEARNFNVHIFIVSISCLTLCITKKVQPLATMLYYCLIRFQNDTLSSINCICRAILSSLYYKLTFKVIFASVPGDQSLS